METLIDLRLLQIKETLLIGVPLSGKLPKTYN